MKYLSLFSGIGGFELGIQQAYEGYLGIESTNQKSEQAEPEIFERRVGATLEKEPSVLSSDERRRRPICIGYSEIDKYAIKIYEKHFPGHKNFGDITKINAAELPDFDLLVGGFPCPSFSIAGQRKGFEDSRGQLFYDICRIAKTKQPMFMLLENVKGLVSHDGGKTLEIILSTLQDLGYYANIEIRNSKDYGVPQNRERIFFLCRHIKTILSVGQNQKITTSEQIIEEWLFQILLNNLKEVKRLQGIESKDWILGYLICQEINQNQKLSGENTLGGTLIIPDGKSSLFGGNPWQNIAIWLNKNLGGNLKEPNKSTILILIKEIIDQKIYTFSKMFQAMLLAVLLLRNSSNRLWNEILSNLILIQEDTKYERINNKNEKAIITESGTAHLLSELQDFAKCFIIGHLRGTPRPKVFPFIECNAKSLEELTDGASQGYRVYGENGIAPTQARQAGGGWS